MSLYRELIDAGFEYDLFNIEQRALHICMQVIEYINKYNKFPSITDESADVRKLANWLTSMRAANHNQSKRTIYPSVSKFIIDMGYPDLFKRAHTRTGVNKSLPLKEYKKHTEKKAIMKCKELFRFIKKHKQYPIRIYPNRKHLYSDKFYDESCRLFQWMSNIRRSNNGYATNIVYLSLIEMAVKEGYPNIFNKNWKDDLK